MHHPRSCPIVLSTSRGRSSTTTDLSTIQPSSLQQQLLLPHRYQSIINMAHPTLLGLPLELRWKILRNCLVIGIAQIPSPPTGEPFRIGEPEASSQLLRVCKQLYEEALPILYQENIMFCRNATYLESFVSQRAPSTRPMIRHVCIAGRNHFGLSTQLDHYIPFFESLPNLRSLNIFLSRVSSFTKETKCIIMATAGAMSLSAPSQTFVERLSQRTTPIDLGVIKCEIHPLSKHSILVGLLSYIDR